MPDAVNVERIVVRTGRLTCDVRIAERRFRYVCPGLIRKALEAFPSLPYHTCVNEAGPTFASVMESTSVPHLIEHIAIDIQSSTSDDLLATFVGTTEWLDEQDGLARIELSFIDDVSALRAFNSAVDFANQAENTLMELVRER